MRANNIVKIHQYLQGVEDTSPVLLQAARDTDAE
jgi:hypothetical protein